MRPTLSVITVVRNLVEAGRETAFRACAGSVATDLGDEVEHIVFDGASTDGTAALIAETAPKARIITRSDHGPYDAMNQAAAEALGDYLLFLNSDDRLLPGGAQAFLSAAGPDFIAAPVQVDDGSGEILRVSKGFSRVLRTMPFNHQGLAMRRELFERLGGFNTAYRISADYDLVLRMFLKGATGVAIDKTVAAFAPGGLSSDTGQRDREYKMIWAAHLPGGANVTEADWDKAMETRIPPIAVLRAILKDASCPRTIRRMARWYRLKGLFK